MCANTRKLCTTDTSWFPVKKNDLFAGTLIKSSLKPAGDRIYPLHLPFTAHKIHKGWSYPIANAKCVSRCTGRKRVSMYFASRWKFTVLCKHLNLVQRSLLLVSNDSMRYFNSWFSPRNLHIVCTLRKYRSWILVATWKTYCHSYYFMSQISVALSQRVGGQMSTRVTSRF